MSASVWISGSPIRPDLGDHLETADEEDKCVRALITCLNGSPLRQDHMDDVLGQQAVVPFIGSIWLTTRFAGLAEQEVAERKATEQAENRQIIAALRKRLKGKRAACLTVTLAQFLPSGDCVAHFNSCLVQNTADGLQVDRFDPGHQQWDSCTAQLVMAFEPFMTSAFRKNVVFNDVTGAAMPQKQLKDHMCQTWSLAWLIELNKAGGDPHSASTCMAALTTKKKAATYLQDLLREWIAMHAFWNDVKQDIKAASKTKSLKSAKAMLLREIDQGLFA